MRLVDADLAPVYLNEKACEQIKSMPTIDAVPVVRCKDCIKWEADGSYEFDDDRTKKLWVDCSNSLHHCKDNHYCNYGERKESNE